MDWSCKLKALLLQSLGAVVATIGSDGKWGKVVQLAGMFKRLSETNQNDFGLEEHFWARPSSSKVGTELKLELNLILVLDIL